MKKKFLVKMFSVFFALALVNNSVVLAKVKTKDVKQQKEQQPKEQQQNVKQQEKEFSQKEKEQEIKTIKEVLKKFEGLEEKAQEKLKNMFKNFKKEDYEVKNYDLEVFFKNNAPILIYTHKKTGAQVYFNLVLEREKLIEKKDELIFKAPSKNDSGLTHFSEHCLASPILKYFSKKLKISSEDFNARTSSENLTFVSRAEVFGLNEKLEKEYVEKLAKELNNPSVFEEKSEIFEVEKKRILNEVKDIKSGEWNFLGLEKFERNKLRHFDIGGEIFSVKKTTLKHFKRFYEKYIHPSNCLLIKNVFELNPKKIKNHLNLWHESYFKHYEKKQITANKYEPKNKEKYLFNSWPKDSVIFNKRDQKNGQKKFKYVADIHTKLESTKEKQAQIFNLSLKPFEEELKQFVKRLGYEDFLKMLDLIILFGNKKEGFTKKALEENSKKIMDFIATKLEGLNEEEFLYFRYYDFKNYNKFQLDELNLKNVNLWTATDKYKDFNMSDVVRDSFNETGKAISNKKFLVNDKNEIESSHKLIDKNIKQILKDNLNVYKQLAKKGPEFLDVYEQKNKTLEQTFKKQKEKYEISERVLPIKFKEKNPKKFVKDFAVLLLARHLEEELNVKRGLIYRAFEATYFVENNFLIKYFLNKDSVKSLEDYIFKNFDEIMKYVKIKKDALNELKKQFKENFNLFKLEFEEYFKNENKMVKDLEKYIKTGKTDKNSILKENLKISDFLLYFIPEGLKKKADFNLMVFYNNFKDDIEFFEKEMAFKEKCVKKFDEKINPEFVRGFLENILKPTMKKLKKAYKLAKEKLKALNYIKISDVEDLIKTAYLVKDKEEIKKVNQNVKKREKRIANF